ncbi:MAG: sugar transferase [Prevotellaceae bacterium]|jgi:lipopolysaccharide/colanic/teichoic acid biosynthesis glycosyltransferase/signal recognition particle subunit SEC65|nr:sugar transferase [Prevotellaceae bacterium]
MTKQTKKRNLLKLIFYKPSNSRLLTDIIAWASAIAIMVIWRLSSEKVVILDYVTMFLRIIAFWFVVSYLLQKYKKRIRLDFASDFFILTLVSGIVYGGTYFGIVFDLIDFTHYSKYVTVMVVVIVIVMEIINVLIYYGYKYATNADVTYPRIRARKNVQVIKESQRIEEEEFNEIKGTIISYTNKKSFDFLQKYVDISSSNTKVMSAESLINVNTIRKYRYDAIINLAKMNSIRGINRVLVKINAKLPDNGIFCICYQSIEDFNKYINEKYPFIIRKIVQAAYFIQKRVLPKILLTNRLWFDITGGKKRIFSNVEMLGRLYYCGFEVIAEKTVENISWIVAKRATQPQKQTNKRYGLVIKLPRVCKNRKIVFFYKMRTMYPYSEYIQKYIYDRQGTDEIGKAKNDIRITKWGKVFRKFWIDELPMIFNLIKGDIKIVGVRPLSRVYFETYPPHLQAKRTKTKPGLIPPFYVDLPKNEQEIFNSEERYLDQYLKSPLKTDAKYFFKAMYNIWVKRARSH